MCTAIVHLLEYNTVAKDIISKQNFHLTSVHGSATFFNFVTTIKN